MTLWTAPGPNGFPSGFYKQNLNLLENDVWETVKSFFHSKHLLKEMNHTFISLIPKVNKPTSPADFRPISLCNSNYKIVSKILVNRMKPFLCKLISPYQVAYVPSRNIQNNVVIAHELVHTMKNKKDRCGVMGLKLDMSKAFDRVEWSFLILVLKKFGFSNHWCQLILRCISTTNISILLNGSSCPSYSPTRGLRQGDPLSPYLFIFCMESFSRYLIHTENNNLIYSLKVTTEAPSISHLLFADDCLLFTKATHVETSNLMSPIKDFSCISGQMLNFEKSTCFFSKNVLPDHCASLIKYMNVRKIELNEKYLGIPLFITRNRTESMSHLNTHHDSRVSNWKGKQLTQSGRSALVQHTLKSSSNYHINYSFYQTLSLIIWRNPKGTSGGEKMGTKVTISKSGKKNGFDINAFSDNWILNPSMPLCISLPNPKYKVSDFINHETKSWNVALVEAFFTRENSQKICSMRIPVSGSDTLIWPYNRNGTLIVKSVYKLLDNELPHNFIPNPDLDTQKAFWKSHLLPKVQLFLWKCVENILYTCSKIFRFNNNHDSMCKSCQSGASETPEHMFLHCDFARNVWSNIPSVSHAITQDSNDDISIKDWISKWLTSKNLQDKSTTVLTAAWCIWKDKCSRVFENKSLNSLSTARSAIRMAGDTASTLVTITTHNADTTLVYEDNFLSSIPQDKLLIFCDAYFEKDTNNSGVGIVVMNYAGDFKGCKLVAGREACPEGAESMEIFEAARWIQANNFQNICLISDAKNVMAYLNNCKGQTSWTSCSVLDDSLFLLKDIHFTTYKHLKRNLNSVVDLAAKHSRIERVSGEWDASDVPYFLQNAVNLQ
ncbi:uncharacterized protein LOC113312850 [Papaver somniferum]|uniref:uncharacterized protein LOC113312850 n=1 Tax=Papaver somniferum TaxID=3469 RepID=UPI000E6F84D4|nr:uncharacterized protein LOC113312850 [Papaver somniferum]